MRQDRKVGLYSGGYSVTEKQATEHLEFVGSILQGFFLLNCEKLF